MKVEEKVKDFELQNALEYTEHIINTVHDPWIILYGDLRVALASSSFYQAFQVTAKETEGKFIYELGDRAWDIPRLRHLLENILSSKTSFDHFEIEHDFPHIGRRTMLLNARRIYLLANHMNLIILTFKDITEHKKDGKLHERIAELEDQLLKSRKP